MVAIWPFASLRPSGFLAAFQLARQESLLLLELPLGHSANMQQEGEHATDIYIYIYKYIGERDSLITELLNSGSFTLPLLHSTARGDGHEAWRSFRGDLQSLRAGAFATADALLVEYFTSRDAERDRMRCKTQ